MRTMNSWVLPCLLLAGCQWVGGAMTTGSSITESESAVNWTTGTQFFATIDGVRATRTCDGGLACQFAHLPPGAKYSVPILLNPSTVQTGTRTDYCFTGDQFLAFRQATQTLAVTRMLVNGVTRRTYGWCLYTTADEGVTWTVRLVDMGAEVDGARIGFDRTNWYLAQFGKPGVAAVNQVTGAIRFPTVPVEERVVGRSAYDTNYAFFAGFKPSIGGQVYLERVSPTGGLEEYDAGTGGFDPLTPTAAFRPYGIPPLPKGLELTDVWVDPPHAQLFVAAHAPCPFTRGAMCGVIFRVMNAPQDLLGTGRKALDDPGTWQPTAIYSWTTDFPGNPGWFDVGYLRVAADDLGQPLYTARWMSPLYPDGTQIGGGYLDGHQYLTKYLYNIGQVSVANAATANRGADWLGAYPDGGHGVWVTTSIELPAPTGAATPAVGQVNMIDIGRDTCGLAPSGCVAPQ